MDTVLHASVAGGVIEVTGEQGRMPFAWSGVEAAGPCGPTVRVRLSRPGEDKVSLEVADEQGRPVASVRALMFRPASAEQVRPAGGGQEQSLYEVQWRPVKAASPPPVANGGPCSAPGDGPASRLVRAAGGNAVSCASLEEIPTGRHPGTSSCAWTTSPRPTPTCSPRSPTRTSGYWTWSSGSSPRPGLARSTLVVLTRRALDTGAGDGVTSLTGASVWGLIRSARTEHPGRFRLVDIDDEDTSWARLPDALTLDEPQLAVRKGELLTPAWPRPRPTTSASNRRRTARTVSASPTRAPWRTSPGSRAPRWRSR